MWTTRIEDVTFRSTDLRQSALGGIVENHTNAFHRVSFIECDMRQTAYTSARFSECTFRSTRLDNVNFQGSIFEDCTFEGELKEVCFNRTGFGAEKLSPNDMVRVDFSRASLRSVEFRNLDLNEVRFPTDEEHIVLNNYPRMLDIVLQKLQTQDGMTSKKLAAYLGVYRRWAGPRQQRGSLNKNELLEVGGEQGLRLFLSILESEGSKS
jgi:hypothetical protein